MRAGIDIYASSGVADGRGAFGYLVYVREDQFEQAAGALGVSATPTRAANFSQNVLTTLTGLTAAAEV